LLKLDDAVGRLERLEEKSVVANDNDDDIENVENELPLNGAINTLRRATEKCNFFYKDGNMTY